MHHLRVDEDAYMDYLSTRIITDFRVRSASV
jgi:hypothetical protein